MIIGIGALLAMGHWPPSRIAARTAQGNGLPDPFQIYMKLYSSLEAGEHWLWFKGQWDVIPAGGIAQPLVGQNTLIRRQVHIDGDGAIVTRGWEGMVFSDIESNRPVDRMINPITGREVFPFHSKEGPTATRTTEQGIVIGETAGAGRTLPIELPAFIAGDDIWLQRPLRSSGPNPLRKEDWPMEASGETYWTNMLSTFRGRISDIRNENLASAPMDFAVTGQSVCVPWLAMGGSNVCLGWSGFGKKIRDSAEMPQEELSWFRSYHPELFALDTPWQHRTDPFRGYMQARKPLES